MPICIECRAPVNTLYTTYSKADDRTLGKGVRLTQCPRCKRFADKYVEHDFVVLFIDLVLIKPQVWRHLLFNRLAGEGDNLDPSIARFGVLLLLFDVYLTWARIEKAYPQQAPASSPLQRSHQSIPGSANGTAGAFLSEENNLTTQPILLQYLFFLVLCTLCTVSFHIPIRLLSASRLASYAGIVRAPNRYPNRVSTALLVSSISKLFPILMVVWDYDLPSSASAVAWAVIANNVAALEILLDCGWLRSILLVGIGAACKAATAWVILGSVGLDMGRMGGPAGDGSDGTWEAVVGLFGLV